jgi:FkbM family methyltransferase
VHKQFRILMNLKTRLKRAARELCRPTLPAPAAASAPGPADFEQQVYAAILAVGDRVFDIGANAGDVSLLAASLVGAAGEVTAFEPVWTMYAYLCRRIQQDAPPRAAILPVNLGISDSEGTANINVPADIFGLGSLAPAEAWGRINDGKSIKSYTCRFVSVDSFIESSGIAPPVFVKIDVEGAELAVLRSMPKLLATHKPTILAELFAPFERLFDYRPWDVLSLLQRYGYEFYFMCPGGLVAHVPTADNSTPPQYSQGFNVIAWNRGSHPEIETRLRHLLAGSSQVMPMVLPSYPNQ